MPNWGGGASGALSGAAKGATFGSVVPGVGTAIGAGVGAIGGFIGGLFKKKKSDKKIEGGTDPGALQTSLANRGKQLQGKADVQQEEGMNALNTSLDYYGDILGNDAGAAMDATKAERGRVIDQYDTARQSIAEFGPRGGGTTSALANSRIQQGNQISDIGANQKAQAAQATADIGATIAGIGMTQEQIASADINAVIDSMLAQQGIDVQKAGQKAALWGDIASVGGDIIGGYLGGKFGKPKAA